MGEEERTHTLDTGTLGHTRAGKSRDSSQDSGRSKWPLSLGRHGRSCPFQPLQDDSMWLNKPSRAFRSPCFLRGAGMQVGDLSPPSRPHMSFFPHCSQSTATRVRVKWGKGHATGKPHPEGGRAYQGGGQNQGALGLAQGQGQVDRLGGVSAS